MIQFLILISKILLKGNMNLRNGVLFLKPENVDLLGGSVEDMSNINYMKELIENELYNYF